MNHEKRLNKLVESTRQALNQSTIDNHLAIFEAAYQQAKDLILFIDREWFFRHLQNAGLKGITYKPLHCKTRVERYYCYSFLNLYKDKDPTNLLEVQSGLTPAYLNMIKEWQETQRERKALARQMQSPCYNCEGEGCICCSYRELRYPTMEFSTIW